ncbi:MAG: hypothetical protein WKG07_19190 [Hymenobacter sp.]
MRVLVILTLSAAIRSFVLPRNEVVRLNVWVFRSMRLLFERAARLAHTYGKRDRIMAHYAPVALVALPMVWLAHCVGGLHAGITGALGGGTWAECYQFSSSSLLTLGSVTTNMASLLNVFSYSEATLGLLLLDAAHLVPAHHLPGLFAARNHGGPRWSCGPARPPRPARCCCG